MPRLSFHLFVIIPSLFPSISDYFDATEVYPKSKELLYHSTVIIVRCGRCALLNPNFIESPNKQAPGRIASLIRKEIIEIEESPIITKPIAPP